MTARTRRLDSLRRQAALDDPTVAAVLASFPGSEVAEVLDAAATPTPSTAVARSDDTLKKGRQT